jgi:uncharacterized protein YbjT (DUF2867 family)
MSKILVLGGTGMLGAPVARRLLADGFRVRLLARDLEKAGQVFGAAGQDTAGFEIVPGDVTDLGSLERAMEGCSGVHVSVGGPVDQLSAENAAALAPGLGLARITYVSGATVREENGWFPMTAQKLAAEEAIRACGVPYTIFCPTWPMEQLPRFARGGQPMLIGNQPVPFHWFAAGDMARMVSAAYGTETVANKRLYVYGPEAITMLEALERYCRVFHPEVESVPVMPIEAAQASAEATGNQMLGFFAGLMAYFEKAGEPGEPTEANRLLGAPATTLDAWMAARATAIGTG